MTFQIYARWLSGRGDSGLSDVRCDVVAIDVDALARAVLSQREAGAATAESSQGGALEQRLPKLARDVVALCLANLGVDTSGSHSSGLALAEPDAGPARQADRDRMDGRVVHSLFGPVLDAVLDACARAGLNGDVRDVALALNLAVAEVSERETREHMDSLADRLNVVAQEERSLLAREIHDRVAHGIMAGVLRFDLAEQEVGDQAIETRAVGRKLLKQALEDAQELATGLRHIVQPGSLQDTIEEYVARAFRGSEVSHSVVSSGTPVTLSSAVEENLYLLTREAVRNAIAHAEASEVIVTLDWQAEALVLSVDDDGRGFEFFGLRHGSLGLMGMKERAESINARLSILSQHNLGTKIRIEVTFDR